LLADSTATMMLMPFHAIGGCTVGKYHNSLDSHNNTQLLKHLQCTFCLFWAFSGFTAINKQYSLVNGTITGQTLEVIQFLSHSQNIFKKNRQLLQK